VTDSSGRAASSGAHASHISSYELTGEAEHLFSKAYDALVNQLIGALKERLTPDALKEVLCELGRSLARSQTLGAQHGDLESGLNKALTALERPSAVPRA